MPKFCPFQPRRTFGLLLLLYGLVAGFKLQAAVVVFQPGANLTNLAEYQTPDTARTIRIDDLRRENTGRMGFLGIGSDTNAEGKVIAAAIAPNSPASKAGVRVNDIVVKLDGQTVVSPQTLRKIIETNTPGRVVSLSLQRGDGPLELTAKLVALGSMGRPIERIRLGVRVGGILPHGGVSVEEVDAGSTGANAGMKAGDIILRVEGTRITETNTVFELINEVPANEFVNLTLLRADNEVQVRARLAPADGPDRPAPNLGYRGGGGRGLGTTGNRGALRIAIIGLEFSDVKHNPRIALKDWEQAFFSTNAYVRTATGQAAHGSINDFYLEQSVGAMRVEGKMFDWIEMSKNRRTYEVTRPVAGTPLFTGGAARFGQDGPFVNEALDRFAAREGSNVLARYDGVFFIYAGSVATRSDTNLFWPHTMILASQNRRVRYSISFEGGDRMTDISILCHETGHILGLPDLYTRPADNPPPVRNPTNAFATSPPRNPPAGRNQNPYLATLANWDLMAIQTGYGRPQHLSAWSKEQLGWIKPAVIDPTVRQKLVLAPIEDTSNQCFKIPLRPDGSEYLLLENRRHTGFDESLPAEGLLIWRVVYGRPVLEEAHGLTMADAARMDVRRIPFPTDRNNAFTPFSKPSSAALTGDGLPVYITDIRRLRDGRITFTVGGGYD